MRCARRRRRICLSSLVTSMRSIQVEFRKTGGILERRICRYELMRRFAFGQNRT